MTDKKDLCNCGGLKTYGAARCRTCRNSKQHLRGNWRGGRYTKSSGYVLVYDPEHPNAQSHGYVLEHVKVMSEYLGRPLLPGETVHHKFGDRSDNSIENLELWVKPQPSGVRAEDAYAEAKEIVNRYKDLFEG